jgi:DNA-binding response OmpR family regulator
LDANTPRRAQLSHLHEGQGIRTAFDQPRLVLVVDDEHGIRDVVAAMLGAEGYAVLTAANGRDGLALLDGSLPHVIVLDLMMPIMDGFAFRAQQLLSPWLARIPVIVVSAEYDIETAVRTLRPQAWLRKPFDLEVLLAAVAAACVTSI